MSYDDAIRWKTLGGQPLNPLTLGLTEWSRPQGGSHDESQSLSDLNSTTPTHVSVSLVCPFLPIKSVENWSPGTNSKHFKAVLINNHLNFAPLGYLTVMTLI